MLKLTKTTAYLKIKNLNKRIRILQGGTSASKTYSIVYNLIRLANLDKTPTLSSIVSESFPHLKRGAMRDFLIIMKDLGLYEDNCWNKTDSVYTLGTRSKIEFFSVDQADKVRGARRERLFINEANNISFEAFEQLEVRTKEFIYVDYNPVSEFWAMTELNNRNDVEKIILTYKDNEALSKEIIDTIEQRKDRTNWWKVYGLGELGDNEFRVFQGWQFLDEIPHEARLERRGLDFGYSQDPTAIIDIYKYNNGFILDEVCYLKGLSNKQIADIIKTLEPVLTIADSAEPKSIDELKTYGVMVIPAIKGPGSVNQGIAYIQAQAISITKRSTNLIKEYRNYSWMKDKDGKILNIPQDLFNHGIDSARYGFSKYQPISNNYIEEEQQIKYSDIGL